MDAQRMDGGWSVNEVLQVVIDNCRSWRVDGMKVKRKYFMVCGLVMITFFSFVRLYLVWQMFTQLHFTYEQESHPEEFFIPYVWKLVLSKWYGDSYPHTS